MDFHYKLRRCEKVDLSGEDDDLPAPDGAGGWAVFVHSLASDYAKLCIICLSYVYKVI